MIEKSKAKYEALIAELAKKKSEIQGLAAGYDKYKDNPAMAAQLENVMKTRMEELIALDKKIDELGQELKKNNEELDRQFKESKSYIHDKELPRVEIAQTPTVKKMLIEAMDNKPLSEELKPVKVIEPKKQEEIKIKADLKKAKPSTDLYDKAAQ